MNVEALGHQPGDCGCPFCQAVRQAPTLPVAFRRQVEVALELVAQAKTHTATAMVDWPTMAGVAPMAVIALPAHLWPQLQTWLWSQLAFAKPKL